MGGRAEKSRICLGALVAGERDSRGGTRLASRARFAGGGAVEGMLICGAMSSVAVSAATSGASESARRTPFQLAPAREDSFDRPHAAQSVPEQLLRLLRSRLAQVPLTISADQLQQKLVLLGRPGRATGPPLVRRGVAGVRDVHENRSSCRRRLCGRAIRQIRRTRCLKKRKARRRRWRRTRGLHRLEQG